VKVNKSWNDNEIINLVDSISDPEECQQMCKDESKCVAWTYTTADNFDYQEGCFLFSSIGQQIAFNDSISGPPDCLCSDNFACKADEDNIVDRIFGVIKEEDCQTLCANNSNCQVYTWYNNDEVLSNVCVLFSECSEQDYNCPGCFTGPKTCQQNIVTTTQESETELAIIVTGSYKSNKRSVEVLRDDGSSLCYLPDLPYDYEGHTQSGLVTCGGTDSAYTRIFCYTFSSGAWTQSHSLLNSRWYHSAWSSPLGTVVMGGEYSTSATTTELLTDDGQSRELFSLKYSTNSACSIELEERVIVTGGYYAKRYVSLYSSSGWLEDLPSLLQGRYFHGCGHYVNDVNKMVYLVTGGDTGYDNLVSTEVLVAGSSSWRQVGDLPTVPIRGLGGVSINNNIIMTGGYEGYTGNTYDYIVSFNSSEENWTFVGTMRKPRGFHAVSVVPMAEVIEFCNF